MNIDPRYMTPVSWAAQMTPALSQFGSISRLSKDEEWPQWAKLLIQLPGIAKSSPPDPRHFRSWQDWAFRFNQAVPV